MATTTWDLRLKIYSEADVENGAIICSASSGLSDRSINILCYPDDVTFFF